MSHIDALTPAPGRTVYPLEGDWVAIILEPLRGHPYRALGIFHRGELAALTDDDAVVRGFLQTVTPSKRPVAG